MHKATNIYELEIAWILKQSGRYLVDYGTSIVLDFKTKWLIPGGLCIQHSSKCGQWRIQNSVMRRFEIFLKNFSQWGPNHFFTPFP